MKCPYCDFPESRVLDSRPTEDGAVIRRRRECLHCNQRFTTYEKIETTPFIVIKKDGNREPFDADKILRGLITACEKRPVPLEKLERLVNEVERELRSSLEKEVTSGIIGELVMDRLKYVDEVAYVRFASVYRQFKDIEKFKEELEKLLTEK